MSDTKLTVDTIAELQEKITDQIKTIRLLMEECDSMQYKLESIANIVNEWNKDASNSFGDMCKIKGILKGVKV